MSSINSILSSAKTDSTADVVGAINKQYTLELGKAYSANSIDVADLTAQVKRIKKAQQNLSILKLKHAQIGKYSQGGVDHMIGQTYSLLRNSFRKIRAAEAGIRSIKQVATTEFNDEAYGVTNKAGVSRGIVDQHHGATSTERISNYYNDIITPIANLVSMLMNQIGVNPSNPNINLQPAKTQAGLTTLRTEAITVVTNQLNGVTQQNISNYRGINLKEKIANYYDDIATPVNNIKQNIMLLGIQLPARFDPPVYTQNGLADIQQYRQSLTQKVMDNLTQAGGLVNFIPSIQKVNADQDLVTVSQNLVQHIKNNYAGVTDQSLLGTSNFDYSSNPFGATVAVQQKVSDFYSNIANLMDIHLQKLVTMKEPIPVRFTDGGTPPKVLYTKANLALLAQYVSEKEVLHKKIDDIIEEVKHEFVASNVQYNQNTMNLLEKAKQIAQLAGKLRARGWSINDLQPTNAVLLSLKTAEKTQQTMDSLFTSSDAADSILEGMKTALEKQSSSIKMILEKKKEEMEVLRADLEKAREGMNYLNAKMPEDDKSKAWTWDGSDFIIFMKERNLDVASNGSGSSISMTQTQLRSNLESIRGYTEKKNSEVQILMQEVQHFTNLQLQGPDLLSSIVQEMYQQRFGIAGSF